MIHFIQFDPVTGAILRFGVCSADDLAIQGPHVLAFENNPAVTDSTHRVDLAARTLIPTGD